MDPAQNSPFSPPPPPPPTPSSPPKEEPSIDLPQNPFPGIPAPSAVAVSTSPSSVSAPPPASPSPIQGGPASPPEADEPPPPFSEILTASPPPHKAFPFMMVTFILLVILAGFGASFLFFQGKIPGSGGKKTANVPVITPPASPIVVTPTPTTSSNPFASPSAAILNPFASPSPTYANPFGQSQNPFSAVVTTTQAESQPIKNPFVTPTP